MFGAGFARRLLASALLAAGILSCAASDGWVAGRSTWYDVGDMKTGNCHYSYSPTGRNVGAWPDTQYGFGSSCGKCYEIRCRNTDLTDGYGKQLSRSNACYDVNKSIFITIVDACPCRYPNNAYSNQRWCCGDMNHIDISQEAFSQLANVGVGVIGLSWREVDCSKLGSSSPSSSGGSGAQNAQQPQGQQQGNWGNWGKFSWHA